MKRVFCIQLPWALLLTVSLLSSASVSAACLSAKMPQGIAEKGLSQGFATRKAGVFKQFRQLREVKKRLKSIEKDEQRPSATAITAFLLFYISLLALLLTIGGFGIGWIWAGLGLGTLLAIWVRTHEKNASSRLLAKAVLIGAGSVVGLFLLLFWIFVSSKVE